MEGEPDLVVDPAAHLFDAFVGQVHAGVEHLRRHQEPVGVVDPHSVGTLQPGGELLTGELLAVEPCPAAPLVEVREDEEALRGVLAPRRPLHPVPPGEAVPVMGAATEEVEAQVTGALPTLLAPHCLVGPTGDLHRLRVPLRRGRSPERHRGDGAREKSGREDARKLLSHGHLR